MKQEQLETNLYYLNHQQGNDNIESLQDSVKKFESDFADLQSDLATLK